MTSVTTAALDYRRQPRGESQMRIQPGMPVRVSMPSGIPEKFPRFAMSFNNRRGKIVKIASLRGIEIPHAIIVDITRPKAKHSEWLYVERSWLSHDKQD